ncbi:hypothetical protein [Neolewinella agarilytica]|uniref:hypothetical protein n=1 Tax=Neolewinella agarilytica TaxID=478744 RepID=UPI002356589E|nr:hypothetical protein [Neolewinella agarilytica]
MTKFFASSKLLMLLLALTAVSFTSCDDDDDEILGIDLGDDGVLVLSSNTSGLVGVVDVEDSPLEIETFTAAGMDSDGIFYRDSDDIVYQVNRSNNTLVSYEDVLDDMDEDDGVQVESESSSDFTNGRGLAVVGRQYVVAQDASDANNNTNGFVIYEDTNDDGLNRLRTFTTSINTWGLQYIGDDMYAVVDNSDSIAIFNDFFGNADNATIEPDSYIRIDGLVRTHGIQYDEDEDIMILTDVGDADSDSDGALFIIKNFSSFNGTTATAADYTKISGNNTLLGNPVDVDYDEDTDRIYVAERKRDGGLLLVFSANDTGDVAPTSSLEFAGISALWLNRD